MKINRPFKLLALSAVCLLAVCLAGCGDNQQGEGGRPDVTPDLLSHQPQSSVTVFYLAEDSDVLVPLVYGINSSRDTIWVALEKLLAGPADSFCRAVVPQGVKMKDLYFANGTVNISLTGDGELTADDINAEAIFATVNNELAEQENAWASVQVYYNDQPLFDEPYYREAVNDFGGGEAGSYVYFADSQAMYVVPLKLAVNRADYADTGAYLQALLAAWAGEAPAESGVYSALPAGINLNSLSLSDGALTLDFNDALLQIGGTAQQNLFVNSLLATLFRVDEVTSVSFSVNGEALAPGTDLGEPLTVPHDDFNFNVVKVNQ